MFPEAKPWLRFSSVGLSLLNSSQEPIVAVRHHFVKIEYERQNVLLFEDGVALSLELCWKSLPRPSPCKACCRGVGPLLAELKCRFLVFYLKKHPLEGRTGRQGRETVKSGTSHAPRERGLSRWWPRAGAGDMSGTVRGAKGD